MDQTTINQFFVARKSSFPSPFPSAKRVKLDGGDLTEKDASIRRVSNVKVRSKSKLRNVITTKKVTAKMPSKCDQFFFKASESPVLKCLDSKELSTRKTQTDRIVDVNDDCSLIPKSLPKPQLTSDDLISDQQAKTILLSRGSAILKAGYEKNLIKSPSKASEILSCLSPQKKASDGNFSVVGSPNKILSPLKSPSKLSDVLRTLTPKKEGIKTISISDSSKEIGTYISTSIRPVVDNTVPASSRRDRLRNKFKHLLKEPDTISKTNNISETKGDDIEDPENVTGKTKAHDKFQHLVQKVPSSGFVFPRKFKVLIEMFRCVDSILFLLNQRSEVCTFQKLKASVQSMCSRNFELEHLAKIKTIYPNGFIFRQEKGLRSIGGSSKAFQLTVEANFKESMLTTSTKVTSSVLITRRLKFENNLLVIMKKHHQDFLQKLNMKLDDSEIHRWHPHFKVDEVPDIDPSSLPQPPIVKEFKTAADLIGINRNIAPKVHNALVGIANKEISRTAKKENDSNCDKSKDISNPSTTIKKIDTNSKMKGVSSSILERIRQKEQNKMQLAMTRDPEKEEKLSKMQRLPEICRILKSYFTTEKKVAITLEDCVRKLCESYGSSVNQGKLEEHVRLLADLVPDWLTIAMVRKFPFVKLTKGYDINKVINTLNSLRREMES